MRDNHEGLPEILDAYERGALLENLWWFFELKDIEDAAHLTQVVPVLEE